MSCRRRSGGLGAACLLLSLLAGAALASTLGETELIEQLRAPDPVRAREAASELGRRGSEAALDAILERTDTGLIDAYAREAAFAGPRAMSTPHIDALFSLLSRPGLDAITYFCVARALSYAQNPGLEPRLLRALPSLSDAAKRIIVTALAAHQEPAVVPYLRAMLASNDPNVHYEGCLGMARVGNEESVREAIGCIGEVGRQNEKALPDLVSALASVPAGTPLDLAALKSVLPQPMSPFVFLDRNDPGGYWVASFVALRQLAEREGAAGRDGEGAWGFLLGSFALEPMSGEKGSPLAVAVQRLARGRGLGLTPPDRRLESPEATWALFLAALRAGDVESAVACFTVDRRPGMRAWLSRLSREELRALADSHAGFVITDRMGAYTEAGVARDSPHGKVLGLAYFVNQGGEWRVSEGP